MSGERTAEHERAFGQTAAISDMARDQRAWIHHRGDGAFLVERAFAAFDHMCAQDQAIPVRRDVVVSPKHRGYRFLAHLLGDGHPIFLHLPIGVIGAGADPKLPCVLQQHELPFSARRVAEHLDAVGNGQPRRRGTAT